MAFVVAPIEESDSTPADLGLGASEESASNADLASDDHSGLYIPNFLGEANDGEWGLTIRMARAIQVDEQQQKCCFICQSHDHFVRNCPQAKNVRRPLPKQQQQRKPKCRHKPLCPLHWFLLRRRKISKRSPECTLFESRPF